MSDAANPRDSAGPTPPTREEVETIKARAEMATPDRGAFEAWMASSNYPEIADVALAKLPDGTYRSQLTFAGWQGWQGHHHHARTDIITLCDWVLSLLSRDQGGEGRPEPAGEDVRAALAPAHGRWTDPRFRNAHTIDIIVRKDAKTHTYEGDWLKDVARALVPCVRCAQGFKLVGDNHVYYTTRGNQSYEHFELCRVRAATLSRELASGPPTPPPAPERKDDVVE